MRKLIFTHWRRRLANYSAVCVELMILLLVGNILMNQLIPFIQNVRFYNRQELEKILCCTVNSGRESIEELAEKLGAKVLWANYEEESVVSDEGLSVQPVEKEYLRRFHLISEEDMIQGAVAVVPASLSLEYLVGETYTVTLSDTAEEITFVVGAVLEDDLMFIPPSGHAALSIVGSYSDTILVALDEEDLARFQASDVYTLEADAHEVSRIVDDLSWSEQVISVMSCEEAQEYSNSLELSQMGMPIIIAITAIILCLAGMLSNTLLSIIENERNNGIYYICGCTWRKIALVQILSDLLAVGISVVLSLAMMMYLSSLSGYIELQGMSFLASTAIVLIIFMLAEALGILQIKKNNVVEIAERMK